MALLWELELLAPLAQFLQFRPWQLNSAFGPCCLLGSS